MEQNKMRVEISITESVNYALVNHRIPMMKNLMLFNESNQDLSDVTLRIQTNPEFTKLLEQRFSLIPQKQLVDMGMIDVQVNPAFLAGLTEKINAEIIVTLEDQEEILFQEKYPVEVFAFDEWTGASYMPEMIAAFVTPNLPVITEIISESTQFLKQWTGNPSFDAYQTKESNRVKQQIAAIFATLQGKQIAYLVPPASFETRGQRIRLGDDVIKYRLGTCLDTTLLMASCLEAVGIHSLVIFVRGHAFLGAWLEEESFTESVQDDFSLLTKRIAEGINQILVVETTSLTVANTCGFDEACEKGKKRFEQSEDLHCFVDIKRARVSGIKPLPIRVLSASGWEIVAGNAIENSLVSAPSTLNLGIKVEVVDQIQLTRQKLWERKLLDLSLRNNLINVRLTANTIPILSVNLASLEDALSDGEDLQILEKPSDWIQPYEELLAFEFSQKRLRTSYTESQLLASMTNLYRLAKVSIEENGANTLFLAMGFLKWYETPVSQKPRLAPLVLMPVELIRRPAKKGYLIRSRDEEPQMNITLLEMLKQDFGLNISGLDPLPKDEKGIDTKLIFSSIRQVIMQMPRWDIVEDAVLGIFSFSQFIMWNDLRNRCEELKRSKVVSSLMNGKLEWNPQRVELKKENLESILQDPDFIVPTSADASQMFAVYMAGEGKSFVLHGPPGTGKSQTITNIIANHLARGKTVLFVAEKMAALSVVERRLDQLGLGSFCLELHSNKSTKKAVMDQLRIAIETSKTKKADAYEISVNRLASLRRELSSYVVAINKKTGFGVCLVEAMAITLGVNQTFQNPIVISQRIFDNLTEEAFFQIQGTFKEYCAACKEVSHPKEHPLKEVFATDYSHTMKLKAEELLSGFDEIISNAKNNLNVLSREVGFNEVKSSDVGFDLLAARQQELVALKELSTVLLSCKLMPTGLLNTSELQTDLTWMEEICRQGEIEQSLWAEITPMYNPDVESLEEDLLINEWQQSEFKGFISRTFIQGRIRKSLGGYAKKPKDIQSKEIPKHLNSLKSFKQEKNKRMQSETRIQGLLGGLYKGQLTNWVEVLGACNHVRKIRKCLDVIFSTTTAGGNQPNAIHQKVVQICNDTRKTDFLEVLVKSLDQLLMRQGELLELLGIDFTGLKLNELDLYNLNWLDHVEQLRDWCTYKSTCVQLKHLELGTFVQQFEQEELSIDALQPAFTQAFYKACCEYMIGIDPILDQFNGKVFEEKVKLFQETIEKYEELSKQEIFARLSSRLPDFYQEAAQSSEIGILQKAIKSNARALSIRRLFEQIPNLLPRLTPCMMMSPISVAQYLDPKSEPFDLVIFDEASQLPTSEAVGAMARGKEVIVVGDPKQLPPTSFFASNTVDEDNIESEDLESILDDCLALSMPSTHLLWHYRSKHESLITFSNVKYYDHQLLTFPSPNDLVSKVKFISVEGYYDRGKTKQNLKEAESVVAEIVRRLESEELSRFSIGVVTFNSIQQNLIDDLLLDAFQQRPDLEEKAMGGTEPVFIKNLENVQGDERDVILFSIGYGPDANGRVSMNFGPLNREGGWRRLNVAVSRARYEMLVFSTLQPEHLDHSRTTAQGVEGLKSFLEYAKYDRKTFATNSVGSQKKNISLSSVIAKEIEKLGYRVVTDVGTSGYKLDIGIIHPLKPDEYLLGVMCDGPAYSNAVTVRDREILQANVLELLGWNLYHLKALHFYEQPQRELEKLAKHLEKLLQENKSKKENQSKKEITINETEKSSFVNAQLDKETGTLQGDSKLYGNRIFGNESEVNTNKDSDSIETEKPEQKPEQKLIIEKYRFIQLPLEDLDADAFISTENTLRIIKKIKLLIDAEAPIAKSFIRKRILQSYGITRAGARIEKRMDELFAKLDYPIVEGANCQIIYPKGAQSLEYSGFRVPMNELERRSMENIPLIELKNAVVFVLENQISLPKEDLMKEVAKLFGYSRMTEAIEENIEFALSELIQQKKMKIGNERCLLV